MTTPHETPAAEAPLWTEPEFAALAERLVADFAPRLFALVEEQGERVDGRIVAWGMEFEDGAEVVGTDYTRRGSYSCADTARLMFPHCGKMRLVWYNPDAATPSDQAA